MNSNALDHLSNDELLFRLHKLVQSEGSSTIQVARHLAEVESRRLYAAAGYPSLYEYAVRALGYSGSSASRRIRLARVGRLLPQVYDYLESGEVTFSALESRAEELLAEGGETLLERLRGKTPAELAAIARSPKVIQAGSYRDRIEPVKVTPAAPVNQGALRLDSAVHPSEYNRSGCTEIKAPAVTTPELNKIVFFAGEGFMRKLERAREVSFSGAREDLRLERVLEEALELYLAKHDPRERAKRREGRLSRAVSDPVSQLKPSSRDGGAPKRSRHIPLALRDQVLERDGYRCTFVSESGVECGCRVGLEIDHVIPFALGGETTPGNLRVLCRAHNLHAAMKEFGREFVERKIEGRTDASL